MEELFKALKLEENTLYKVRVKTNAQNVEHDSFLFTGFRNGNYCMVVNNTYESPVRLQDVYSIKVIKKLAKT